MIDCKLLRQARPGTPVVIAVFSYRYDAHLVPDLIENIRPFVHGYVAWDDRAATDELTSEPERRNRLLAQARQMGARWILAVDPDERIETSFAKRLPEILALGEGNLWNFAQREMFTPDSYRIDGIWAAKKRILLFPAKATERKVDVALHGSWIADLTGYNIRDSETNYYHLRMATPDRRRFRRDLYATADPTRQFQAIGYDYLDDDRGMMLEPIPKGRAFKPAFIEDHGLWSPDPGKLGTIAPDPPETRLTYVGNVLAKRGHAPASHVLQDLAATDPADPDLLPMAAMLARTAGDLPRTRALASMVLDQDPDNALALYLRGLAATGDAASQADLSRLKTLVGDCLLTRDLQARLSRDATDFTQPDALWRRWIPGPATCHEGARIARSPIAVVVISYRAQAGLAAAVASLRAQDPPCEITVVNSGGGSVAAVLAGHLDHIRLITTDQHLFVGAARNIGIDASRARIVAFLAGDCQALPGWIAGRMREHDLGAHCVSNPVVPEPGASALALAATAAQRTSRNPMTPLVHVAHYGRSMLRDTLSLAGYYPTGLRVAEDTAMNRRLDRLATCVWAADVQTTHREPSSTLGLFRDNFRRGVRMASEQPFRGKPGKPSGRVQNWLALSWRNGLVRRPFVDESVFNHEMTRGKFRVAFIITLAKFLGVRRGISQQAKADRSLSRAEKEIAAQHGPASDARALALAQKAARLDSQDPAKLLFLGTILVRLGQDGAVAFRSALALDPIQPKTLTRLLAPLVAKADWPAALATAEVAAENAPQAAELWMIVAEVAAKAGRKALAIAYLQRSLSLAPQLPESHAAAQALYHSLGNLTAAALRRGSADRLRAYRAKYKEIGDRPS